MKLNLATVLARMLYQHNSVFKYGTLMKWEGIIKAILENPKADQNTLFSKYLNYETTTVYF